MSPQRSANITAAVILVLLAAHQIPASTGKTVQQGKVNHKDVGQNAVKLTCSPTCSPSGNCHYRWYRGSQQKTENDLGCSSTATVWIESTSSSNQGRYSCKVNNNIDHPSDCKLGKQQWGVIYTPDSVCALEGSSVDLSCSYKHPGGLTVTESFWFINKKPGVDPVDLRGYDQYKGRVQYYQTQNQCRMRITDLRASDARIYKFRFITDDSGGKHTGKPGVSLSVTGLKIEVLDTQGGGKQLICRSTCTLTNPAYIWYRNGQTVSEQNGAELDLNNCTVDAGSYSCTVKEHEEIRSAAVCGFDVLQVKVEGAAAAPAERQTVTLTCSSMCSKSYSTYTWYRNEQPVSDCRYASCSVSVVSGEISYSCAVKSRDLRSAPVYSPKDTRAVVLPSGEREEGDSVTLTCSSDADPPVLTFHWFKQRSAADEALGTGQNYSITNISSQHSGLYYCTALNQLGQHSSAPARLDVFNKTAKIYAASGIGVVLLLIFITVLWWMRKRAALSCSRSEGNSGEADSPPVYETVSDLAMTFDPSGAASSDDQDEVQYSTVQFKNSRTQEVPLSSTVHQINAVNEEEEVLYSTVVKDRAGAPRKCENPIYSMVH